VTVPEDEPHDGETGLVGKRLEDLAESVHHPSSRYSIPV
jgi:hypothetical protein